MNKNHILNQQDFQPMDWETFESPPISLPSFMDSMVSFHTSMDFIKMLMAETLMVSSLHFQKFSKKMATKLQLSENGT